MTSPTHIPKPFLQKLRQLRRQLVGWAALRGLARWLLLILGMFVVDMVVDRVFSMDLAQRGILLGLMVIVALAFLFWRVLRPLFKQPSDLALIYEVEAKHPQLREGLLSAAQLGRDTNPASGTSSELVKATIAKGFSDAQGIDFSETLNEAKRRVNFGLLILGVVGLLTLAIGVTQSTFLNTWFNRNLLLGDAQWPRQTYLTIAGAADGRLQLPRGADHRQVVEVTADSAQQNVSVNLEIDNPAGRVIQSMKATGRLAGREHMFVFHNVSAPFRFRAMGGDDVTDWVRVELVEPPAIIDLKLVSNLPAYTAQEPLVLEGGGPHALLAGSSLDIQITSNTKLSSALLQHDGEQFPLVTTDDSQTRFALRLPGADEASPLRGGEYQFVLHDEAGLENVRKSKFSVTIKEDKPPQVRASLLGISGLVVPQAVLPTSFEAIDDYGLEDLKFECQWKTPDLSDSDPAVDRQIGFAMAPVPNTAPPVTRMDELEVLDLSPLKLPPGTSFRFQIAASDRQPETPGVGKSQEFLLRVVTSEELRADLLRREIEQRKAFLQARDSQLEMRGELDRWAFREPAEAESEQQFRASQESDLIRLLRDQKSLGTSIDRVATRFEEFLVEVQNNRLDERLAARFEQGIIVPIRELDAQDIGLATRQLDGVRLALSAQQDLAPAVDQTLAVQQEVLDKMKVILDAMISSEEFQEMVSRVLELKADQQALQKDIERSLEPKNIFDDEGVEDLFDD